MRTRFPPKPISSQTIGNMGLHFVCYQLSRLGWNVMPTSRNARGVDIVAYTQSASRVVTIQVKSLSKRNAVPLGPRLDGLVADFIVIVGKVASSNPECHIMTPREVRRYDIPQQKKDGVPSHWLPAQAYERFKDNWERIGRGIK